MFYILSSILNLAAFMAGVFVLTLFLKSTKGVERAERKLILFGGVGLAVFSIVEMISTVLHILPGILLADSASSIAALILFSGIIKLLRRNL